jgi:8-oxo-dGTP pyrophosphatase MutT (NUDIX family)
VIPGQFFHAQPDSAFDTQLERRQAVRLLLFDAAGRVLLLRHVPPLHDLHWAGPGGGVEADEDVIDALIRECQEELGLRVVRSALRPCGEWRHSYLYRDPDHMVVQHETLFCMSASASYRPQLGLDAAADGIDRAEWFSADQVASCDDDAWPSGLAEWMLG